MPAAPILTDDVKRLIAKIYRQDKTQPAKVVLNKVHEELGQTEWPKLSVIQRELKKNKDNDVTLQSDAGVENPESSWHLGLMAKYNMLPEAVLYILTVQDWLEKYPDWLNNPPPQEPLSIREALWVGRLYCVIDESRFKKPKYLPSIARFLYLWAKAYASREHICELSGTPFDTSNLDKGFRKLGLPFTAGKTTAVFYSDKSFSIDTIDKDLVQQMEQMKKDGEK